jgi:eukaryotic-like serine/threonine-protein kinase
MPANSPEPASAAGLLGGRYRLLEPIAEGGMSTVFRAHDTALEREVAVKVIRYDPAVHGDLRHMRERFRREAANAARIPPHPNVVQVHDYGTDAASDRDFIVMELLPGRDLKALLRERRLHPPEAIHILLQAARGLAAGHRVGVVHRDVKPANLLVSERDGQQHVRILDFGIAKDLDGEPDDDLTRLGGIPHTPAYASPEQRRPGGEITPASDVYQLALLAYELLTGERAFDAAERERIARGEDVPLPVREVWSRVPAAVRALVEFALNPDPAARPPDAAAFAEDLARAAEDERTIAVPDSGAPGVGQSPADETLPGRLPGVAVEAHPRVSTGARRGTWIALLALTALLAFWTAWRAAGGAADDWPGPAEWPGTEQLEETFAPLYREAAERVATDGD